jgi:hypothetical protein
MADVPSIEVAEVLGKQLETASRDLLRDLRTTVVEVLMAAEADAICGAPYRSRSQDRVNARNGYRLRDWDTRVGTIEVAIPKLRSGFVLAGLAAGARPPRRAGPGLGGGHLLPAGGLDPADGAPGRGPGGHPAVEVAGQRDGQDPRRGGRGVSRPAVGRRAVSAGLDGRADPEGPRGRAGADRARLDRGRGKRRGPA